MIDTKLGPMDEALLEKREYTTENDDVRWDIVEYWYRGEIVKRSGHALIKKGLTLDGVIQVVP